MNTGFILTPNNINRLKISCHVRVKQKRNANLSVDGETLRQKACEFANGCGYDSPNERLHVLDRWKLRHDINNEALSGEASAVNESVVSDWKHERLLELLKKWSPSDIYNVDETALFWKKLDLSWTAHLPSSLKKFMVQGGRRNENQFSLAQAWREKNFHHS